jgi:hypothetical protein
LEGLLLGRTSSFTLKLIIFLVALGSVSTLFAGGVNVPPDCTAGNLASYISLTMNPPATGGCAIGILDYYNVSYNKYSQGTNAPSASNIAVAPEGTGFTFGPVSAAPGQIVSFEIDYEIFIDPAPVITGDSLRLDVSGDITITEYFCNDLVYIGNGLCTGSHPAQMLQVGNGNGLPNSATIDFGTNSARASQQVGIVFTLNGGLNGASFDGLDSASIVSGVPEPASLGFTIVGLLTLAGGYKLRKRHKS